MAAFLIWQACLVPSGDALPDLKAWTPDDAKLSWEWSPREGKKEGRFSVRGFGSTLQCAGWDHEDGPQDAGAKVPARSPFNTAATPIVVGRHPTDMAAALPRQVGFFSRPLTRLPPLPRWHATLPWQVGFFACPLTRLQPPFHGRWASLLAP